MESHDKDVEELRIEVSHHPDCYNDLWLVHETSLEEVQKLRPKVIALRSGIRVDSAGEWLGGENRNPEGPSSRPGDRVVSPEMDRSFSEL